MYNVFNKIVKYSIYVLVFLIPLFFLPFSFEAFEYNKQYLLFFLTTLALFSWLAKMVLCDKEVRFKRTPLDLFVLGFLGVAILSAIFSVDKSSSIFGFYGRFSNGLLGLLSFGMLYFLITNIVGVRDRGEEKGNGRPLLAVSGILKVLLWSASFVIFISYLSVFGLWAKIGNLLSLPGIMSQSTFNPIAGSLEGLSIFLAVLLTFLVGRLLLEGKGKINYLLLFTSLFLLFVINSTAAWLVVLISLFLFVGFSMWRRIFRENVNRLLIPIFLIIVAVVCIFFQPQKVIFGEDSSLANLPREQVLGQSASWGVAAKSAVDNVKTGFLGSGIGTFHYDFAKQKSLDFNQDWLWQIRFDRAGNHFAEIFGTMGFLGIFSYLALIGLFLMMGYFFMLAVKSIKEIQPLQVPLLLIFLALLVSQFVYYQATVMGFLFWLILGLSVASWQRPISEKTISFKDFPELSLVFSTLVIILGVVILSFYFYGVNFYRADINYAGALSLLGEERVEKLEKAVILNSSSPRYRVALARTYLYEAVAEMQKPEGEQDSIKIQSMVARAIDQGRIATTLQPNSVGNWENLGVIYREIRGVASGALDWGVKSFEKAITLEPTNPVLSTELGKLYLIIGDSEKARENFNQAIEKKSNYADAIIQKALLLEREDILDEAIKELEGLVVADLYNIEARFQLGRLYFNNNQITEAILQFSQVIILAPDHSNAYYSLGVAYAAQGEKQKAILAFEKVLELNPGNQDVIQKIKSLQAPPAGE